MWILVHVTDSVRPTDAWVNYPESPAVRGTVAAAEGIAAPVSGATIDVAGGGRHKARRIGLRKASRTAGAATYSSA